MDCVNIRLAIPDDAPDMAEIVMRSWEAAYKDIIPAECIREKNATHPALFQRVTAEENNNSYVIRHNGKNVGVMKIASPLDDDMGDNAYELHYIYLHPDFFRMGIGTQAIEFAAKAARGLGKTIMTVWVFAENISAIHFYAKCGFMADGAKKFKEYGRVMEIIRMRKDL